MIVDTSAVLAVFFDEEHAAWVVDRLTEEGANLFMSTVNLAEALVRLRDRQPTLYDDLEARLLSGGIVFVPPDIDQARAAAAARLRYPLNFGDCFAYALSQRSGEPLLFTGEDFLRTDVATALG